MSLPSITELPNELTTNIDVATPIEIVRLLRASDAQIFNGYHGYPALADGEIIDRIAAVVRLAASLLGRDDAAIVIAGAGTSGRLAMFAARTANRFLAARRRSPNVRHLMAGGDLALIAAREKAEDDPHQAWADLEPLVANRRRVLYVGVTCGFSAPYVAGQLVRLSRQRGASCVLLGFNPQERARTTEVENWHLTFADAVRDIAGRPNCVILNPVVGPEPITGSTRMKGGSATKLLLEVIFALGARQAGLIGPRLDDESLPAAVRECTEAYEQTRVRTYEATPAMADLVALGGRTLRTGGHIYYAGAGSQGILGIIDASECPPTFGADFETVRGFLVGGWRTLLGPGRDLSSEGPLYRIALDDFRRDTLPNLTRRDLVVGLATNRWHPGVTDVVRLARRRGAKIAGVQVGGRAASRMRLDAFVHVPAVPKSILPGAPVFAEYATKLIVNALTTGAHVQSGKVYQNRMVDLRISNNKLFHRTIGILQHITGVSADRAKRCLLRSLYRTDRVTPAMLHAPPSCHVEAATGVPKVVPRALILAGSHATVAAADRLLAREPIVRAAIERLRQSKTKTKK